jgi:hypothetical protein
MDCWEYNYDREVVELYIFVAFRESNLTALIFYYLIWSLIVSQDFWFGLFVS